MGPGRLDMLKEVNLKGEGRSPCAKRLSIGEDNWPGWAEVYLEFHTTGRVNGL